MPLLDYLRGFSPRSQPAFVRRAYTRELVGELSLTFPLAMLQAGVISVIGTLLFGVGPMGVATITAAPMFANATSTVWARLAHGRRKAVTLAVLQSVLLVFVVLLALLPILPRDLKLSLGPFALMQPSDAAMFVGIYVLSRCFIAGAITVRTVIWRANYPRHSRSRITGRLMLLNTLMLAFIPLVAGKLFNEEQGFDPRLYLAVYLAAALAGIVGVISYAGLRVRREPKLLDDERAANHTADAKGPSAIRVLRT
ncbi:MAG: hypothetical protein ACPGYV_12410, partial [Phycisphaeraceae bacterium]